MRFVASRRRSSQGRPRSARSSLAAQNAWHSKPEPRQTLEHVKSGHRGTVRKVDDRVGRGEENFAACVGWTRAEAVANAVSYEHRDILLISLDGPGEGLRDSSWPSASRPSIPRTRELTAITHRAIVCVPNCVARCSPRSDVAVVHGRSGYKRGKQNSSIPPPHHLVVADRCNSCVRHIDPRGVKVPPTHQIEDPASCDLGSG